MYIVVCLLVAIGIPPNSEATMYICRNDAGVVRFTNAPSMTNCKEFESKSSKTKIVRKISSDLSIDSYDSQIALAGSRYQVDPNLIKAVIHIESDFNRYAVSKQGAKGLMQLMPATAREMQVHDPFNPYQNIQGGTMYLRNLLDAFENDLVLTLAAYNAGPTLVKKLNRVPKIPETVQYVKKVLRLYQKYRGGEKTSYKVKNGIRVGELKIANSRQSEV